MALYKSFKVKYLRELKFFLGIEALRYKEEILLNQRKYVFKMISELGLAGSKPTDTPTDINHKFTLAEYDTCTRNVQ